MGEKHTGRFGFWLSVIPWLAAALKLSGLVAWPPNSGHLLSCIAPVALLVSIAGLLLDKSRGYAIAGAGVSGLFLLLFRHF